MHVRIHYLFIGAGYYSTSPLDHPLNVCLSMNDDSIEKKSL